MDLHLARCLLAIDEMGQRHKTMHTALDSLPCLGFELPAGCVAQPDNKFCQPSNACITVEINVTLLLLYHIVTVLLLLNDMFLSLVSYHTYQRGFCRLYCSAKLLSLQRSDHCRAQQAF